MDRLLLNYEFAKAQMHRLLEEAGYRPSVPSAGTPKTFRPDFSQAEAAADLKKRLPLRLATRRKTWWVTMTERVRFW
ncbi:MAG: hypothetical protein IMX01_01025 [Limnochordaceae bacterium]|nr:hypothetical protein [Limnochordaceae bacterium]